MRGILIVVAACGGSRCCIGADEPLSLADRLRQPVKFQFAEERWSAVRSFLSGQGHVPIFEDYRTLEAANVSLAAMAVTASDEGQPLGVALERLLRPHGLAWIEHHDVVLITTSAAAKHSYLDPRVYMLTRRVPADRRLRSIMWGVAPESWANVGGPGDGASLPPIILIILQSPAIHSEIAQKFGKSVVVVRGTGQTSNDASPVERALIAPVLLDFRDVSLAEALRAWSLRTGAAIVIDPTALEAAGVRDDMTIDIQVGEVSNLASGLSLLLERVDSELVWLVDDSRILITTNEVAQNRVSKVSYDCQAFAADGGAAALLDAIQFTIRPESWEDVGGDGVIELGVDEKTLEITQDAIVHRHLQRLMVDLRAARAAHP